MPFCPKCGTQVADKAQFCPNCGQAQGSAPPVSAAPGGAPPAGPPPPAGGAGMQENVAAMLSYAVGWLTGLIFLLIDKRPFVKFHAAQSLIVFGGLHILQIVLGVVRWSLPFGWGIAYMFNWMVGLLCVVLWILLMIKAHQGERFRIPVAADLADKMAGT